MAFRTASFALRRMMSTSTPRSAEMSFTFAAPNAVHYNKASVKQVDVPSFSGAFGILPAHVPSLAVLKPGVVTVYEDDGSAKKFFVSSGSITINDDSSVQILAEEAHAVEDIDLAAAREVVAQANADISAAADEVIESIQRGVLSILNPRLPRLRPRLLLKLEKLLLQLLSKSCIL